MKEVTGLEWEESHFSEAEKKDDEDHILKGIFGDGVLIELSALMTASIFSEYIWCREEAVEVYPSCLASSLVKHDRLYVNLRSHDVN